MENRRFFLKTIGLLGLAHINTSPLWGVQSQIPQSPYLKNTNDELFWRLIRQQFSIPEDYAYLNTGTIGISPHAVIQTIQKHILDNEIYGFYGGYDQARQKLATFLGTQEKLISLTHSTTEGINIVANGLPLQKGDEVIITSQEHAGNGIPWLLQAQRRGIVLRVFDPQNTVHENLSAIEHLTNHRTRVIAIPHISCTIGTLLPIAEISTFARSKGIWTVIDGAHATGMIPLNLTELGCDFYISCCHKWLLGSKGTGYLYLREEMLDILQPVFSGADATLNWNISTSEQIFEGFPASAHRYDYGTRNSPLWQGVIAAIHFFEQIGMDKVQEYTSGLASYLYKRMKEQPNRFELLTPEDEASKAAILSFKPKDSNYKTYAQQAARAMLRVRQVPESGLNAIRISCHIYNNKRELDKLVDFC